MPEPRRTEDDPKEHANRAVAFFNRCVALRLSRQEATDLTVAYLLGRVARPDEVEPKREPWE